MHQGRCSGCGRLRGARLPKAQQTGYGPRLTALIGELSALHRISRRGVQDFCRSVLGVPISLGAIQRLIDRTSLAIVPHDAAIARLARKARVGYVDETPWYCRHTLQWLWSMVTDTVALYRIHAKRSQEAFGSLIEDWRGILVSDGYGVYQAWGNARQTCLAHLIRRARQLSQRQVPDLAACGKAVLKELQRLCQMAHAPPSGEQWQAWYARLCRLMKRYGLRPDDGGRLVRCLRRELSSLWVFLNEPGVEPTNNRAERALRFGVLWRKGSLGTAGVKGNAWVQRRLSQRQTCRQLEQSTFSVLVDALEASCTIVRLTSLGSTITPPIARPSERLRLYDVRGASLTDEEIKELRRKNVNYCLELAAGITYCPPGGGTVGSGSNTLSVTAAIHVRKLIQKEEHLIVKNIDKIAIDALNKGVLLPDPAIFKLQLLERQFCVVEQQSEIVVRLEYFNVRCLSDTAPFWAENL